MLQSNEMHDSDPLVLLYPVHIHPTIEQSRNVKSRDLVSQIALLLIIYLGQRILSIPRPLLIFSPVSITPLVVLSSASW